MKYNNIGNQKSLRQILFPKYDIGGLDTIYDELFNSVKYLNLALYRYEVTKRLGEF